MMTDAAKPLILSLLLALPLISCSNVGVDQSGCGTIMPIADMQSAKSTEFSGLDGTAKAAMTDALALCLGDPDPAIRDGLAYEGLTQILRSGDLAPDDIRRLREQLLSHITRPNPDEFSTPFAALVLSEVARTDRITPYMTEDERRDMVKAASDYVRSVSDYRGYSDSEGWRHGVAHGADWLLQLALNPTLTSGETDIILAAIRVQVTAARGHAYIHGEPGRLARPVLFITAKGQHSETDWADWLAPLIDPAPMDNWGDAFASEAGLARLHNVKAFLQALFVSASNSSNEGVKALLPPLSEALRALP